MEKNLDEKQILFLVTILLLICYNKLLICYNKLWKKILTKNKFIFSQYFFLHNRILWKAGVQWQLLFAYCF